MNSTKSDHLYAQPLEKVKSFTFDDSVATVFSDMIQRSVPGYATVIHMSGQLARRFAKSNTHLYDLGCSLGATSVAMASNVVVDRCKVMAVDNSTAMLNGLRTTLAKQSFKTPIEILCEDVEQVNLSKASVVAMNYTLQFIDLTQRLEILRKIRSGMIDDGILILSEKISFDDAEVDRHFIDLYHDFKRANGYSDLEISQKRDALEDVLLPETLDTHRRRLTQAGFSRTEVWFQCLNFASLLAFR